LEVCPENALTTGDKQGREVAVLDRVHCTACGRCVDVCYPKALRIAGSNIAVGELIEDVRKDIPFFQSSGGGVTLTGGEPFLQPEFSYNFLLACNQRDIHTALETTGYARWELITQLSSVTNLFLYDVKFIDSDCHKRYTGVSNELILNNLMSLTALNCEIQVRVPCIPGINDGEDQIRSLANFVSRIGVKSIALLPYNAAAGAKYRWIGCQYTLSDRETQTQEYMNSLADICRDVKLQVQIGG
jgi:pyruvate formate lyase activating enzyme